MLTTAPHTPDSTARAERRGARALAPLAAAALALTLLGGCGDDAQDAPDDDPPAEAPAGTDETDAGSDADEPADDSTAEVDVFDGVWRLGHDSKVLSAEELSDLLEQEAADRDAVDRTVSVECGDGVDTGAGDDTAECIAYADDGVEHLWAVTVGPADAGLEIEVENIG